MIRDSIVATMHAIAGSKGFPDHPVVTQGDQGEQPLGQVAALLQAIVDQRRGLVIEHHEIRVLARFEVADAFIQV